MSRTDRKRRTGATKHNHEQNPEGDSFLCERCGRTVFPTDHGTRHRNHCPHCLWSRHLDRRPGDRLSSCRAPMRPIGIWMRQGEWILLHRCERCTTIRGNRIAPDDDMPALMALAASPLANPPLPIAGAVMENTG